MKDPRLLGAAALFALAALLAYLSGQPTAEGDAFYFASGYRTVRPIGHADACLIVGGGVLEPAVVDGAKTLIRYTSLIRWPLHALNLLAGMHECATGSLIIVPTERVQRWREDEGDMARRTCGRLAEEAAIMRRLEQ